MDQSIKALAECANLVEFFLRIVDARNKGGPENQPEGPLLAVQKLDVMKNEAIISATVRFMKAWRDRFEVNVDVST